MKTILVTGGAGYAGITITEYLAKRYSDCRIIIFDKNQRACNELASSLKNKMPNIEIILPEKADIRDAKNFEEAILNHHPEVVVHLAADVTNFSKDVPGKNEERMDVNFHASSNIAKICKNNGVRKFIHQSTVTVYGLGENITEEKNPQPLNVYGKSKLLGEKEIISLNDELFKVVVFRAATIVGYNINFKYETMINLMCVRSVFKVPFSIFESALENNKTYLDVKDNARAIIFAIDNIEKTAGKIFNLASFNASLNSALQLIKKELNEDFPYNILKEQNKNKQVYTINFDKLKSLGFNPDGRLDEIIKETIFKLKEAKKFYNAIV